MLSLGACDPKWTKACCGLGFKKGDDIRSAYAQSNGTWVPTMITGQSAVWGDALSGYRNSIQHRRDYINSKTLSYAMKHYQYFKENYILCNTLPVTTNCRVISCGLLFLLLRMKWALYIQVSHCALCRLVCLAFSKLTNDTKNIVSVKASKFWAINTQDANQYECILWNLVNFLVNYS